MKKYVLSTLMCLASYAGAFASNEVIENDLVLKNIEKSIEFEITNLNIKSEDPNCFTSIKTRNSDGEVSSFSFSTRADGDGPCGELANGYLDNLVRAGYEIVDFHYGYCSEC